MSPAEAEIAEQLSGCLAPNLARFMIGSDSDMQQEHGERTGHKSLLHFRNAARKVRLSVENWDNGQRNGWVGRIMTRLTPQKTLLVEHNVHS